MILNTLKEFIPPIIVPFLRSLKNRLTSSAGTYKIGDYTIQLPPNHRISEYQEEHKLYDRFLPVLARYIKAGESIVDVGANIGDTPIMMLNETKANIICIEPSDKFYEYLEKNVKQLPEAVRNQLSCFKAMVGTDEVAGKLVHDKGTATIDQSADSNQEKVKLDVLLKNERNIKLIKVDTDGFDFDVLLSASEILKKDKPILFWENQIDNDFQHAGYKRLYELLTSNNYKHLYIFDNFGNVILRDVDFRALEDINHYIYSTNYGCTRTIFYTDVLAVTPENESLINQVIDTYKSEWISAKK